MYPQTGGLFFYRVTMKFNKPAKTIEEQLTLLVERGLTVEDPVSAMHHLRHLNYYRLAAYWLPFESTHYPHRFIENTKFEQVLNYYLFDRELRILLLSMIELIEVSLRTQWAYHLSHQYGSHGYLINTKAMQKNSHRFEMNCQSLQEQIDRSDEEFIRVC
ncbi:MAG: Abi family protein [Legionellales bacterium]|nr:Abi family protein [Legionellales bacterium]